MATLKLTYQQELRRIPTHDSLTFHELEEVTKTLFPVLRGEEFDALQFAWIDDENDCVIISSDLELEESLRTMRVGGKGYLRFDVRPLTRAKTVLKSESATENTEKSIHVGVACDECHQSPILGIRYKCSVRGNYDICQNCEAQYPQPFPMIKYYEPRGSAEPPIVVTIHPSEKCLKRFERPKPKEWKEKKHRGVRCDECGVRPISGIRYKCTHRVDYDVCSECEAKKPRQPFPMVKVYSPDQCPEGLRVDSQNFGQNRDITIECEIDMNKGMKILQQILHPHQAPHVPSASASPNEIPIHRFVRCNECGMKPIMGYRYKCTVRQDYDLCASCEAKIPQPFPMLKLYNPEQNPQPAPACGWRARAGGRGWHGRGGKCGWREAVAERAREHIDALANERATHQEKETRELEEDLISATLEQAIAAEVASSSSSEESKSGTESFPEAAATCSNVPLIVATPIPMPPRPISKPMSRFVRDVTMPDGTTVQPSSTFVKTWRIRNDGGYPWPEGCSLVNAGGDALFDGENLRIPVGIVHPGEEADLSVTLTAPTASGRHVGYFRLQDPEGNWFGQRLWSDIRVNEVEENLWQVVGQDEETQDEPAVSTPVEISSQAPTDSQIWARELDSLAAMGFMDHAILLPLLKIHLVHPAVDGHPNAEGMQALILTLLSNM